MHYWIVNADAPALMGPIDTEGTWCLIAFGVDRSTGLSRGRAPIDAAAGTAVHAEILSTDPWTAGCSGSTGHVSVASSSPATRRTSTPFGAHGLNTGIGDAR